MQLRIAERSAVRVQRMQGTEMLWLQPVGAEAILQIREASLSEDGRLQDYLSRRPGLSAYPPSPTGIGLIS